MLNKIHLGDCLEIMKDIPDKSIDMIICDLPYEITKCKWDIVIPFEPLWEQYKRVIKPSGAIVLTAIPPFSHALGWSAIDMLRYSWYWRKPHTGQLNAKRMPLKNVEEVLVFYNSQPCYNPQFSYSTPYVTKRRGYKGSECYGQQRDHTTENGTGKRYPMQVLEFKNDSNRCHPTQKPVALFEYLIKTYTNEGEIVLDNCIGSGTTALACINTNRNFIGIEKDEHYFNLANERIKSVD